VGGSERVEKVWITNLSSMFVKRKEMRGGSSYIESCWPGTGVMELSFSVLIECGTSLKGIL
jgi:hypothetical protein